MWKVTDNKAPLWVYVIAVLVAWTVVLGIVGSFAPAKFVPAVAACAGFLLGMLAMFIAVHVYKWK